MNGRITQSDVARKAGVHATTVSLALRNHPSLPLATRQKLQALAQKMGYRPDPALRALMVYRRGSQPRRHTTTLAYVTHAGSKWGWKKAPAHAEFFTGATARAAELGYQLEHFWLGEPGMTPSRLSGILLSRGITGIIFASHWSDDESPVQFDWPHFSAVKIDFAPRQPVLPNVTNDQRAIMQLAVQQAVAAGYRRIGAVMPMWWDEYVELAWSAGFLAEQTKLPARHRVPILSYAEGASGRPPLDEAEFLVPHAAFDTWFQRYQPDAIISYRPFVVPQFAALGLRVPRDVAYADVYLEPGDTATAGVHQNSRRVGELAVELLAGQLEQHMFGLPALQTTTLVEGSWQDGATMPKRA